MNSFDNLKDDVQKRRLLSATPVKKCPLKPDPHTLKMGAVGGWIDGDINAAVTLQKTWVELIGSLTDHLDGGFGPRFLLAVKAPEACSCRGISACKASPERDPAAGTSLGPLADQAHGKQPHGSRARL